MEFDTAVSAQCSRAADFQLASLRPCLTHSSAFIDCVFLNASGPKLPSSYTRSFTTVHRRTLTCSPTLPTFQVAEDFALPTATASSSLRLIAPLLAAEHFRLLALSATGSYVGNISGNFTHSIRDVSVHKVVFWHSTRVTFLCTQWRIQKLLKGGMQCISPVIIYCKCK